MQGIDLINNTSVYRNPASFSPLQGPAVMQPNAVYSKIMLRTIELSEQDLEFAKLAVKRSMPSNNGSNEIVFKRMLALAAHTQPLVEGMPPASDQGRMVAIKASTRQYGRYMEFTDKVNWAVVDPLIQEYTRQLSLKVPETKDLIAQQALLAECQYFYASEKEKDTVTGAWIAKAAGDISHIKFLTPECTPTIDEFRRIVLTLEAAKVRPLVGKNFLALVSPAVYFDLITDKRVQEYMKYSQTAAPYTSDSTVDMFSLVFRKAKTIKTDNSYVNADGSIVYLYHATNLTIAAQGVDEDHTNAAAFEGACNIISPVPYSEAVATTEFAIVPVGKETSGAYSVAAFTITSTDTLETAIAATTGENGAGTFDVLNVHYSYVLGEESLFEIAVEGHGEPQFISKPLGSAGTSDPLNQRQSIGWKLDSIGYKVANPDAVQAYLSIPTQYRINVNARPDLRNQFTDYDYGYVDASGNYYHPEQVIQVVTWDGSKNVVGHVIKGTTTAVTAQKLTKLVRPVVGGRVDANGQNVVVRNDMPTTYFALKSNVAVRFLEGQVTLHTDGKYYISGLAGTSGAEVIALPTTATETVVSADGTGTESRTVLYTTKTNLDN